MADDVFDLLGGAAKVGETTAEDYSDALSAGDESERLELPTMTKSNVSASPRPDSTADQTLNDFLYDFYYRIWVFPKRMLLKNPRLDVTIPFAIWNAYPYPNTLNTITPTDATGLTLNVTTPSAFRAVEYRTVGLVIDATAPREVDATFEFGFDMGSALFEFITNLVSVFSIIPNVPVRETLEWLTDIIPNNDGTEQRIALRSVPRRSQTIRVLAVTKQEVKDQIDRQFFGLVGETLVPYFQYATALTQDHDIGDDVIYFNPGRTDVRVGEYVLIRGRDGNEQIAKLLSVGSPASLIDTPLAFEAPAHTSFIIPVLQSLVKGEHSIARYAVDDVSESTISASVTEHRLSFKRPDSATEFPMLDDLIILDKRPMANVNPEDQFQTGTQVIDYDTGYREIRTPWLHSQTVSPRQYLIHRTKEPLDLDFWRDFLDTVKGRQGAFLTPTYREDGYVHTAPVAGSGQLKLVGTRYSDSYFPLASHKHLRLWTTAGAFDVTVVNAVPDSGNDLVTFTPPIPTGWTTITHVSFLSKVRLGSDEVELEHGASDTVVSLSLRTVDE